MGFHCRRVCGCKSWVVCGYVTTQAKTEAWHEPTNAPAQERTPTNAHERTNARTRVHAPNCRLTAAAQVSTHSFLLLLTQLVFGPPPQGLMGTHTTRA